MPPTPGVALGGGAALESTANKSANLPEAAQRRLDRWDARADLWLLSSLQRVRHCGRVPQSNVQAIALRAGALGPSWAGLQHCGSVHAEPVCAATIRAHRALEVGAVLGAAMEDGCTLTFGTLTMRHRLGQPLPMLWDAAKVGWHEATASGGYRRQAKRVGVLGWVRVWEVTSGDHGWHVHPHWVIASEGDGEGVEDLCESMFSSWERAIVRQGLSRPLRRGQEWHQVSGDQAAGQLGEYLFKLAEGPSGLTSAVVGQALGFELTSSMPGRAATVNKTQPVWALLDALRLDGDADAGRLWHEWEQGSKGRRQIGWGGSLRDSYEVEDEMSDDAVANLERGSADDDVLRLLPAAWRVLVGIRRGPAVVIEAWYREGLVGACSVLDDLGVAYDEVGS